MLVLCLVVAAFVLYLDDKARRLVLCLGVVALVLYLEYRARWFPRPLVSVSSLDHSDEHPDRLFVLVHGLSGDPHIWDDARAPLRAFGDVLVVRYPDGLSNADPEKVSAGVSDTVRDVVRGKDYADIVLVGYSAGALIARKAFLYAGGGTTDDRGNPRPAEPAPGAWADRVSRVVLMAGMNRGWDLSGRKPSDMGWGRYFRFSAYQWLGLLTRTGKLALSAETGSPFVADLRLEWMDWFRAGNTHKPFVVQMLGDIDDLVNESDDKDLRTSSSDFTWVKVRGSGHDEIIDFKDPSTEGGEQALGRYRMNKFLLAALAPAPVVRRENEEQPFQVDDEVTHVVFLLHGIRDLGRWSAEFETGLLARFKKHATNPKDKLVLASLRYGYFGMGPFLLRPDRKKYVRWFMDGYTETRARYPNAKRIDFVGHSNGTYLLASALEDYRSLKVDHIVFAGSVVPRGYNWDEVFERHQVQSVRNYVASDDYVVALFPRLFETWPIRLLGNDLGSAGFNGFDSLRVANVKYITGHHSAFLHHIGSICGDVLPPEVAVTPLATTRGNHGFLKWVSDWAVLVVWVFLVFVVIYLGFYVSGAARQFALPAAAAYVTLVYWVLNRI